MSGLRCSDCDSDYLRDFLDVASRVLAPWVACPFCSQPLVEEMDGTHCGGCVITWWEGVR